MRGNSLCYYCIMAEGFDRQSDILSWIHSVEAASPDPPQDELDWGLTSNPDSNNVAFGAHPAPPRGHQALDKHLSAPASVPARPRFASLGDVLPAKQAVKQSPRGSLARASPLPQQRSAGEQSTAKKSQIAVKHVRQKSLSPLPDPTQRPDLPAFTVCRDKKLFQPKPPLLANCLFNKSLPVPGSSVPKTKLLWVSSDLISGPQPRSAPVSPDLESRKKEVVAGADVRPPLRRGELIREKSYSPDNLMKMDDFSDSDASNRSSNDAAALSDYNVSTVHSGDEGTSRDASVRVTGEASPSLTVTESAHTGQASLTGKGSDAGSGPELSCNSEEGRQLQPGDPETLRQLQAPDQPPAAAPPGPPPQHSSTVTPRPPEKVTLSPTSTEDRLLFAVSAKSPSPVGWKQHQRLPLPPSSPVGVRQYGSSSSPSPLGWKQQRSSSSSPSPTEWPRLLSPTESPALRATPLSHQKLEKVQGFQFLGEEELTQQPPTVKFLSKRAPTGPPRHLHPTTRRPSDYSSVSSASSSSGTEGGVPRRSSMLSEELITERRLRLEKRELQLELSGLHAGQIKSERSVSPLAGRRTLSLHPAVSPKPVAPPVRHTHTETELFLRQQQQQQQWHRKEHVSRQDSGIGTLSSSTA